MQWPERVAVPQYDMTFDAKYDALSLNAAAGPNPEQAGSGEYFKGLASVEAHTHLNK